MEEKKLTKQYNGVIKQINDNGVLSVYVSTGDIDRDSEIIMPNAWILDNYKKNPVIVDSHTYESVMNTIGKAVNVGTDSKGLWMDIKYLTGQGNPKADWAFVLAKNGMAAFSVGFIPVEKIPGEGDVKNIFTKAELLEVSQVVVPANPEAVQGNSLYAPIIKEFKEMITKPEPEVTENTIRIRVEDPDKFVDDSFRTITISAEKGIKAVIGKYKTDPNGSTHVQSYIFDKDKWTVSEAQAWVDDHGKSFEDIKDYFVEISEIQDNASLEAEKVKEFLNKLNQSLKNQKH